MEINIHEMREWDFKKIAVRVSFRIVVSRPEDGLTKARYLYALYWEDPDFKFARDETLDMLMELFVMHFDAGYTKIYDLDKVGLKFISNLQGK